MTYCEQEVVLRPDPYNVSHMKLNEKKIIFKKCLTKITPIKQYIILNSLTGLYEF